MNIDRNDPAYAGAFDLIERRHRGVPDKLGRPMVEHFPRVAHRLIERCPHATVSQIQAALLHDAFEPGGFTEAELMAAGVTGDAIRMIRRITLPTDGRTYLQYATDLAASGDAEAVMVKLADNLDAIALFTAIGTEAAMARVREQYLPSVAVLEAAIRRCAPPQPLNPLPPPAGAISADAARATTPRPPHPGPSRRG